MNVHETLSTALDAARRSLRVAQVQLERTGSHVIPPRGNHVLVVEDERPCAFLIARLVQEAGMEPIVAHSSRDGCAEVLAHGTEIAAAIVDWGLPDALPDETLLGALDGAGINTVIFTGRGDDVPAGHDVVEKPDFDGLREWIAREGGGPITEAQLRRALRAVEDLNASIRARLAERG